tara:strand:+ start:2371 stop:3072 length:702 start_codon:yes stop_codon:yes gene_type:complete
MAHNPMGDGWTDDSVFENSWLNVPADSTTTNTYTISTGADDGVARRSNGGSTNSYYNTGFSNSSAKNYVGVQDDEGANDYYACYFRFNNVVAEQGATIQSAYFKFNKVGFAGGAGDYDFYVAAYDGDNETAPTTHSHLNHINYTTAEVAWGNNTDTGNGTLRSAANGTILSSPDIKTAIQEVVDRPGWSSGNSIVIAFYAKVEASSSTNWIQMVRIEMYDDSGDDPAQLEITV